MTTDLRVLEHEDTSQMLPRARRLFGAFVALAIVVFALEWLDASTPLWPRRAIAAVAIAGIGAWAVALVRHRRHGAVADVAVVALLVAAGWGMGRPGAILVGILAVLQLRAMYGTRWSLGLAAGGVLGAYVAVEVLGRGFAGALTLGTLTVLTAGAAVVLIVRALGEVLARRDLEAGWNAVLTDAGVALVAATAPAEVTEIRDAARARIAASASAGLDVTTELAAAHRRLDGEVELALERIRSQERYRTLAEHSRDGIYLLELGPRTRYRYLNPAGAAMLGIEADTLLADPGVDREVLHPADHAELAARRGGGGAIDGRAEVRVRCTEGGVRWLSVEERELEAEDGTHLVLGTMRDVTEERRREEALRSALERERLATEELRAVDDMKSTFLRALSHELRTPLAAVVGATETLRSRWEQLSPEQVEVLAELAERRARHLGQLLEDLLDVDRLSRGAIEPRRAPTAVLALVRRVAREHAAPSHPVRVDGEEVTVAVDGPNVERIVDNLLRNAAKHTPAGTTVRCEVRRTLHGVQLAVEDDGPGVDPAVRATLFAPFVQGVDSGTASQPGTGIGLTLVSKLAQLHGGEVRLEEPIGGGARFVVELPGAHLDACTTAADAPHERPARV